MGILNNYRHDSLGLSLLSTIPVPVLVQAGSDLLRLMVNSSGRVVQNLV